MNTISNFRATTLTMVFLVGIVACQSMPKPLPVNELSPQKKTEIIQSVVAWLECEECDDHELERLKKTGQYAVPTLAAALDGGPSQASLELMRLRMEERYDRLIEYGQSHPKMQLKSSKEAFVAHYMDNYVALYRIRAVQGLSAIGGKQAREAIEKAANEKTYREDVNKVIIETLGKKTQP